MLKQPRRGFQFTWRASFWLALLSLSNSALASSKVLELTIQNHLFVPSRLYVPADQKVKIVVRNRDDTPEEFESFSLNREKVILANSQGVIFIGPLVPGEYPFFGEYNPQSAQGVVIVVPADQWQESLNAH